MHCSLLAVGLLKTPWIREGCRLYLDRTDIDVIEIPASKQKDSTKQFEEESQALLKRLERTDGQVWVLDETGKGYSSEAFASELEKLEDQGIGVTFVLGGAYGLSDEVRNRADRIVKLSDMTFPHELCRLVFLEQFYRVQQIIKGSGYHH
ncbi:MAG: 23S rRNA (pseudouridine(1915)-N(3))-methyltransferase RlmH [Candidatus Peregrinibacteria bacterium]|nr:23S rRNA (pseudouridine(1915)-N(3))-methyltransferase RlmH [Candidatus Peregrinibacteria bacterium]MCB9808136.1 23S rRNA (pseudouridine(1915)-N(3))-methyltransferase RlmH [Candidatus Peribacteria bacterium]